MLENLQLYDVFMDTPWTIDQWHEVGHQAAEQTLISKFHLLFNETAFEIIQEWN